jgi:hypothetical protein
VKSRGILKQKVCLYYWEGLFTYWIYPWTFGVHMYVKNKPVHR